MGLTNDQITERRLERESRGHVYGMDVSKWQDTLDWTKLPSFVRFVLFKVSQSNFKDPKFFVNYDSLRRDRPDVKAGGYHFLTETQTPRVQAETYARYCEGRPFDLYPNCDLESVAGADPRWPSPKMAARYALEWMQRVEDLVGHRCANYSSARHLDVIWDADQSLALELAEHDGWMTGYWDNWPKDSAGPKTPECYKHGRKGKIIGWQWSSGKLASGGLSRPVPEIEAWRPGHRLDHNLALDLDRWLIGGSSGAQGGCSGSGEPVSPPPPPTSPPAPTEFDIDEEAATAYNARLNPLLVDRRRVDAAVGADSWGAMSERLQQIAAWQHGEGLKPDGWVGPSTRRAMGLE